LYLCYCIDKESGDRRRAEVFELVGSFPSIVISHIHKWLTVTHSQFEYKSRHQEPQAQQQQAQQQVTRLHRPQPVPPSAPHAPQPISQRVEGIVSPESSPELSPTIFQADLEGQRQHRPPRPLPAQVLQRQESSEMDPFLPDLDAEPEPEPREDVRGYDVSNRDPVPDSEDDEGTDSALFPGSDIF